MSQTAESGHVIDSLKLPLEFDAEPLRQEMLQIDDFWWVSHFRKSDYEGVWTVAPLMAPAEAILPYELAMPRPDCETFAKTDVLRACPGFDQVLSEFQCPLKTVRLMRLAAGARILEHTDKELSYEDGEVRLHIPIETSSLVEFHLNHRRLDMQPGETWYLNVNLPHSVRNESSTPLTHLVIDCAVNDWLRGVFDAAR